jgi:probable rRNA maturation factor
MTLRVSVSLESGMRTVLRGRVPGGQRAVEKLVRDAVRATFAAEKVPDGGVSVTLVGDDGIAALNRQYLARNGATDVIAFPLYERGEPPVGDVYIGLDQAVRQAEVVGVSAAEEIARLAVHGALHVLGHVHPEGAGRTRSNMWKIQERIVAGVMERRVRP